MKKQEGRKKQKDAKEKLRIRISILINLQESLQRLYLP